MTKKLTNYFILAAIIIVFLFAPRAPGMRHGYFPLFLLFGIFLWQRDKIRSFLKPSKSRLVKYLLIAIVWSLLVERVLGQQQEARYPFLVFLISLTFAIPYFLIWHKLISKFKNFIFSEIFILSGLSGALAQALLTSKILGVFADVRFIPACFMAFYNFLNIFVMFGMLTSLPFALIFEDNFGPGNISNTKKNLFALASVFFALPIFIFTLIILRGIL